MKDETLNYEKQRIILAKELRVPPDDINLRPVLKSAFRSIRESCENLGGCDGEYRITIKDKEEEEAILCEYGRITINRIFDREYPFENVIEDYSKWYISVFLSGGD
jgi:hypothetical protein